MVRNADRNQEELGIRNAAYTEDELRLGVDDIVGEMPFWAFPLSSMAAQEVNAFGRCQQDGKNFAKYLSHVRVGTIRKTCGRMCWNSG